MGNLRGLKLADIAIVLLSAGAVIAFAAMTAASSGGATRLVITSAEGRYVYPLSKDAVIDIPGPLGKTRLRVEAGSARVIDSPCENKLCVSMGRIKDKGQWVSCLPNRVFAKIEGADGKDAVDAATF